MGDVLVGLLAGPKFMHLSAAANWLLPSYFLFLILFAVRAHLDTMVKQPLLNYIGVVGALSLVAAMLVLGYEDLGNVIIALALCFTIIGLTSYIVFVTKFDVVVLSKKFILPQVVTLFSLICLIYLDATMLSFPNFFGLMAIELCSRLLLCGIFFLSIKPIIFRNN